MKVTRIKLPHGILPKRSKYRSTRVEVDGLRFDSKKEARRWGELKLLLEFGKVRDLHRQVEYRLEVNGVFVCKYRSDFTYQERTNGLTWSPVVEDAKGFRTQLYEIKRKLMLACHGIAIRET